AELDAANGVDEVPEESGASDGGELERITDQRQAPALLVGEVEECSQLWCGDHGGLVDDHGRARWEVVEGFGRPVEAVLDQQLVDGVGTHPGLDREYLGRRRRRGDTEHDAV